MRDDEFGPITDAEVFQAVCNAEVVETYPDDTPYPSVLLFGFAAAGRPLHIVCGYDQTEERVLVITLYQPDPDRWEQYRRRIR